MTADTSALPDFPFCDATACAGAIATGDVSALELLDLLADRVDRLNPDLNAVVTLDLDRARELAAAADRSTAAGESWGPLHGVPMTVKDVWETAHILTTSGAPELAEHIPETDAVTVARLKRAGAVIFAKTNTPLYAGDDQTFNDVFGITNNPWDTSRTPGGSSGGAAAALAAGLTPLELGSDIGGSIRMPSHLCGTFGLKPSWGLVPSRGHIPGRPGGLIETDVNSGGPMARSVRDLVLGLGVLAGPLPEDASAWRLELPPAPAIEGPEDLRIAVVLDDQDFPVSSDVRAAVQSAADRLADAGAQVRATSFPVPLADMFASWQDLVLPIVGSGLPPETFDEFTAAAPLLTGDDLGSRAARSLVASYRDHRRADQVRQLQRREWATFFDAFDVVLAPALQVAAFHHDTMGSLPERTLTFDGRTISHLGLNSWCGGIGAMLLPVVAVPVGLTDSRLPVGVQVIGPYLHDLTVLAAAQTISDVLGGFVVAPPGY